MTTDIVESDIVESDIVESAVISGTNHEPPRLAAIRTQLMRQNRTTGLYLTPAKFDFVFGHQQVAISTFFAMARTIAVSSGLIMTRAAFERTREQLRTQADGLRETTAASARLKLHAPGVEEGHTDPVIAATREIEDRIIRLERKTIVVERDHGDTRAQAVSIDIAQVCCLIFGRVLPSVVAALASAVLDTTIERHRVRDWWKAFTAEE